GDEPLQFIGLLRAMLRQSTREGVALHVQRVWQMVDTGKQRAAKGFAVVAHAAHRDATEADAVVGQLTSDQPGTAALADGALVSEGNLQCGVGRFRAGIGEEHTAYAWRGDLH